MIYIITHLFIYETTTNVFGDLREIPLDLEYRTHVWRSRLNVASALAAEVYGVCRWYQVAEPIGWNNEALQNGSTDQGGGKEKSKEGRTMIVRILKFAYSCAIYRVRVRLARAQIARYGDNAIRSEAWINIYRPGLTSNANKSNDNMTYIILFLGLRYF